MIRNPKTWLILRENATEMIKDPGDCPTQFYIQELAKLFEMPYEDALADPLAPDTRKYIQEKSRNSKEDIDALIIEAMCGG